MNYRSFLKKQKRMKRNKIFKIKKNMEYSLREYAVYSVLACYTDKNKVSHISREILSKLSGVKDLDTISKYTSKFEKDNLIKKTYKFSDTGKRIVEYKILEPGKDYLLVSSELFSGNPDLIGFLCALSQYKIGNTNKIELSNKAIIEKLNISKPTFNKYLKIALKNGSVTKTENGYLLSSDIFPICEQTSKPTEKQKEKIDFILSQESKAKNILLSYYCPETNTFNGLKGSADDFINFLLAGCPKNSKQKEEINILI